MIETPFLRNVKDNASATVEAVGLCPRSAPECQVSNFQAMDRRPRLQAKSVHGLDSYPTRGTRKLPCRRPSLRAFPGLGCRVQAAPAVYVDKPGQCEFARRKVASHEETPCPPEARLRGQVRRNTLPAMPASGVSRPRQSRGGPATARGLQRYLRS